MVVDSLSMLKKCFLGLLNVLQPVLNALSFWDIAIGLLCVVCACRFLLMPLVSGGLSVGSSDVVRKKVDTDCTSLRVQKGG